MAGPVATRINRAIELLEQGQAIYYELNTSVFQDLIQHLVGWIKPFRQTAPARRRTQEA